MTLPCRAPRRRRQLLSQEMGALAETPLTPGLPAQAASKLRRSGLSNESVKNPKKTVLLAPACSNRRI